MKNGKQSADDRFFEVEGSMVEVSLKKAMDKLLNTAAYTNPIEAYTATMESIEVSSHETPVKHEQWERLYEVTKNIRLLSNTCCFMSFFFAAQYSTDV